MHKSVEIKQYREYAGNTDLIITVHGARIGDLICRKRIHSAEIRLDDGRTISAEQRRKAYATIRDISDFTGYLPEEQKEWLKYLHIEKTGCEYFSLSDCTMDTAREFINTIIEYAIENGIPLSESALERTDDIGKYLYYCIIHQKCSICGQQAEIHHEDAIGMGYDRRIVDDSHHKKIALCRIHHTIAHQMGVDKFRKMYKVYGIVVKDVSTRSLHNCSSGDYISHP